MQYYCKNLCYLSAGLYTSVIIKPTFHIIQNLQVASDFIKYTTDRLPE